MAGKHAHAGGKYARSHTTAIPAVSLLCKHIERLREVTRISLGFIKAGLRSVPQRRAKVQVLQPRVLKLSVRDHVSQQEVFVYISNTEQEADVTRAMRGIAQKEGIALRVES